MATEKQMQKFIRKCYKYNIATCDGGKYSGNIRFTCTGKLGYTYFRLEGNGQYRIDYGCGKYSHGSGSMEALGRAILDTLTDCNISILSGSPGIAYHILSDPDD